MKTLLEKLTGYRDELTAVPEAESLYERSAREKALTELGHLIAYLERKQPHAQPDE